MEVCAQRCPWYVAGPLIGLIVVGLRWAANKHFGALGAYVDLRSWAIRPPSAPSWRVLFFAGAVIGGTLSALVAGTIAPSLGRGQLAGLFTLAGLLGGIALSEALRRRPAPSPALGTEVAGL